MRALLRFSVAQPFLAVRFGCLFGFLFLACAFAPGARAEYAVLRSGIRIHITGYENLGGVLRLHVAGGTMDVAIEEIVNIEPEEVFAPAPPPGAEAPSYVRYAELINAAAKKYGLDAQLLAAVAAVESNFDPRAISRKNAQGVMQLIPQTSARLAVQNPFDPAQSIDAGARYLKEMLDRFHGDMKLALAAYNAGPDRVEQYRGVPPFRETQDYVAKVTKKASAPPAPPHSRPASSQTAPSSAVPLRNSSRQLSTKQVPANPASGPTR